MYFRIMVFPIAVYSLISLTSSVLLQEVEATQDDLAIRHEIEITTSPSNEIDRVSHVVDHHVDRTFKGFWKKKFGWRPRWVKTWQEKKVYVAVWKRMWGPAETKEWVPIPKPPPGWLLHHHAPLPL